MTIDFQADAQEPLEATQDSLKRLAIMAGQLRAEQVAAVNLDDELAACEARVRKLAEIDIPELLRECGLTEVRLEDGSRVTVAEELSCAIAEARRPVAYAWLRDNGLGGIIKTSLVIQFERDNQAEALVLAGILRKQGQAVIVAETIHPQTLKATLKDCRSQAKDVPAEPFSLRPFSRAKITPPPGVTAPGKPRKRQ